jgi:uncharacterized membrane protein YdjX (TVP38/TMEM64 family)
MRRFRPLVLVAVLAALLWASHRFDLAGHLSVEGMRSLVDADTRYGPLVFIGVCIAGILLHVPGILMVALGGALFDRPSAFAYGWIGSVAGTTLTFVLVRWLARDEVQRALPRRFARLRALDERLERHGFVTVVVLRLVLFLAPPLNWTLGATSVRAHHYVAGTAVGLVPGIAATVFFADAIANRDAASWRILIGALLVAGFLVVARLASRRLFRRTARST